MRNISSLNIKYLLAVSIIVSIIFGSVFTIFYFTIEKMLFNQVYQKADIVVDQTILLRKWVANMRGVYVIQRKGIEPNRFLPYPTLSCNDINLVLRNPALVTQEISELTKSLESYFFKLTSDKVINPKNAPDNTEKNALRSFKEKKIKFFKSIENIKGKKYFRLIKPLYVESTCLTCHVYQGYNVGDLRGAISVFVPIDSVYKDLSAIRHIFIFSGFLIVFLTTIIIYFSNYFLTIKPIRRLTESVKNFSSNMQISFTPSGRNDEIGILEENFYEMANKIQNNYKIMESEIEKATKELKKKDRIKTDFLATVAHELRTPLTTIQGGIEYLSKVLNKKENIEFIEIIDKNIKNLIFMMNNFIDIARIELGKLELELREENIKEILEEVLIFFKGYANEKNINFIKKELFDYSLFLDKRRINQVFINVLHNAIKFSPKNKVVEIIMKDLNKHIEIEVINETTFKVEPENIPGFFEKYKNLSNEKEKGSGLGLAISKGIMQAHKGDISIEAVNKNTFKVTLMFLKNNHISELNVSSL